MSIYRAEEANTASVSGLLNRSTVRASQIQIFQFPLFQKKNKALCPSLGSLCLSYLPAHHRGCLQSAPIRLKRLICHPFRKVIPIVSFRNYRGFAFSAREPSIIPSAAAPGLNGAAAFSFPLLPPCLFLPAKPTNSPPPLREDDCLELKPEYCKGTPLHFKAGRKIRAQNPGWESMAEECSLRSGGPLKSLLPLATPRVDPVPCTDPSPPPKCLR